MKFTQNKKVEAKIYYIKTKSDLWRIYQIDWGKLFIKHGAYVDDAF